MLFTCSCGGDKVVCVWNMAKLSVVMTIPVFEVIFYSCVCYESFVLLARSLGYMCMCCLLHEFCITC